MFLAEVVYIINILLQKILQYTANILTPVVLPERIRIPYLAGLTKLPTCKKMSNILEQRTPPENFRSTIHFRFYRRQRPENQIFRFNLKVPHFGSVDSTIAPPGSFPTRVYCGNDSTSCHGRSLYVSCTCCLYTTKRR